MGKDKQKLYKISDVEKMLSVNRKTLFYWEKVGKIPPAKREVMSNYRYWTETNLKKIRKIMTGEY